MKISRRVRRWVDEFYDALRAQDGGKIDELLGSPLLRDLPLVVAAMDDRKTPAELDLLYRLANLEDGGAIVALRTHFDTIPESESDEALLGLRDQLREIWPSKHETDVPRQEVVGEWFGGRDPLTESDKWSVLFQFGIIRPVFFRGELAWAFCRHRSRLAKCHNPDCPAPYFVARRRDQKYCSASDECARYAARAAARKYSRKKQARKGK